MSLPTASSAPQAPLNDDRYMELLASVRERFRTVAAGSLGEPILLSTSATDLFEVFLAALPTELRQHYTCSACKRFVQRYGGAVLVTAKGKTAPVMWDPEVAPEPFTGAIRALAEAVSAAPIDGVFLSNEETWGIPVTGPWHHLAVTPPAALVFKPTAIHTTSQIVAEKLQDHATLVRGLEEFPIDVVQKAHSLLTTGALYRSEKCEGVAKWLLALHEQRRAARNARAQENLTWRAVAAAPAGFCHVRSTMIGTLLEDLVAGLPFEQIKARFDAKMSPVQYQRPVAPPTAGNIAQAEKIIATLRTAGSLERRFAQLADLETLWLPASARVDPEKKGVFSHLKARGAPAAASVDVPAITLTWDKFSRTVLPTAESIEFFVPPSNQAYVGMVTAKNPEAPPIVQWDLDEKRNPVTWYFYTNGSTPSRWNLKSGVYHPVTAVALQPSMWGATKSFAHQGEKVIFVLEGARDTEYQKGAGFFPEFLRSEYHAIRATIEAYAKEAVIEGKDSAGACGIGLQKGLTWNHTFRVSSKSGVRVVYKLDRWD